MALEKTYYALVVRYSLLRKALDDIHGNNGFFKARVSEVKLFPRHALLIIEKHGDYPYLESKWKKEFDDGEIYFTE